jgi:hypothetical protein
MWWPGGYYRKALEERKKETEEDLQAVQADEQLVVDLDTIIAEAGYKNLDSLIQEMYTKDDGRDKRTSAIADVFLKMRARGYDRERLRK